MQTTAPSIAQGSTTWSRHALHRDRHTAGPDEQGDVLPGPVSTTSRRANRRWTIAPLAPLVSACLLIWSTSGCSTSATPASAENGQAAAVDTSAPTEAAFPVPSASTANDASAGSAAADSATSGEQQTGADELDEAASAEIELADVDRDGYRATIAAQRGRVVLVDFWATWCGPCKEQFPHSVELAEKYSEAGLTVVSVSCDEPDNRAQVLDFLAEQRAPIVHLLSVAGFDTLEAFDIEGTALPYYELYDRQGNLARRFVSGDPTARGFTHADIEEVVRALLAE